MQGWLPDLHNPVTDAPQGPRLGDLAETDISLHKTSSAQSWPFLVAGADDSEPVIDLAIP